MITQIGRQIEQAAGRKNRMLSRGGFRGNIWEAGEILPSSGFRDTGRVSLGGVSVTVAFAPGEGQSIVREIVQAIDAAEKRIFVASMVLSSGPILAALSEAIDRDVRFEASAHAGMAGMSSRLVSAKSICWIWSRRLFKSLKAATSGVKRTEAKALGLETIEGKNASIDRVGFGDQAEILGEMAYARSVALCTAIPSSTQSSRTWRSYPPLASQTTRL